MSNVWQRSTVIRKTFFKRDLKGRPILGLSYIPIEHNGNEYALYKSQITGYWQIAIPATGQTIIDMNARSLNTVQAIEAAPTELDKWTKTSQR
jgi:hypothetical protein